MKNIITTTAAMIVLSTSAIAQESFPSIHAAIGNLRNATQLSEELIRQCKLEKDAYHQSLVSKYDTTLQIHFGNASRIECYIVMMKMALIDFEDYQGWAFRYALRFHLADDFQTLTASSKDPYLHFSAIFSLLSRHRTDHAIRSLKYLQAHDSFLAETAVAWVDAHLDESRTKSAFLASAKSN